MNKPKRIRAEIIIRNKDKILITINHHKEGLWHGLPGGGIDGDSLAMGITRECLEETGIVVKNLENTGYNSVKEGYASHSAPGRSEKYSGSITHLFVADFDHVDMSQVVPEDLLTYTWMSWKDGLKLIEDHYKHNGGSGDHAVRYLKEEIKNGRI